MQPFKQTYLILSAQEYRMVDEQTGAVIEGISLWYLPSEKLDPVEDEQAQARGEINRGIKVAKMNLPLSKKPKVSVFPALYDVTLEMATVQQRLQVRATDIDFVGTVKMIPDKKAASA